MIVNVFNSWVFTLSILILSSVSSISADPSCADNSTYSFKDGTQSCSSIYNITTTKADKFCSWLSTQLQCPVACQLCCGDNSAFRYDGKSCDDIDSMSDEELAQFCSEKSVTRNCRRACRLCDVEEEEEEEEEEIIHSDPDEKPNLIIMMTDEHNLRTLGCYRELMAESQAFVWGKGVKVDTPNIDRLAQEGALFSNYYVATPKCTPSRASFLSGQYPMFTGAWKNHEPLDSDIITFADVLYKTRGYRTGYSGKWHLDGLPKPGFNSSQDFGFKYHNFKYNRGHWKFFEGFGFPSVDVHLWEDKEQFAGRMKRHYATDYLFDRGIKFMENSVKAGEPFVSMISIPDPHSPNEVRPPFDTKFNHLKFELPKTAIAAIERNPSRPSYVDHFDPSEDLSDLLGVMENENVQKRLQLYFGMVACIDENVGKVLKFLDENNMNNNTIVMFTSDHGDLLYEHAKNNKGSPYQTSASAPLVIRYPDHIQPGKVIKSAYSSIDIFPTLMTLMNARRNNDTEELLSGLPGLDASVELINHDEVSIINNTRYMTEGKVPKPKWVAAFTHRYKLVLSPETPWLFDMEEDPDELINYIDDPKYVNIMNGLRSSLVDTILNGTFVKEIDEKHIFLLDKPSCMDSRNRLSYRTETKTCDQISDKQCEKFIIRFQCPRKCNVCCEDTEGSFLVGNKILSCNDITDTEYCRLYPIALKFCPKTCNNCNT